MIYQLCLREFSKEFLRQDQENPLTIEDLLSKSVGGKKLIHFLPEIYYSLYVVHFEHLISKLKRKICNLAIGF